MLSGEFERRAVRLRNCGPMQRATCTACGREQVQNILTPTTRARPGRTILRNQLTLAPFGFYFTRATKLEFGYMVLGWGTESGEQGSAMRSLLATYDQGKGMGVTNRGRYSNPAFDTALSAALVTMDDKKREGMIQQAAEMVMGDVGMIPLHYEISTWATARASSTLHAPINTPGLKPMQ